MYMGVFIFLDSSVAFLVSSCLNMLVGLVTVETIFILEAVSSQESGDEMSTVKDVMDKGFHFFPQYCFGRSLMVLKMRRDQAKMMGKTKVLKMRRDRA
ncbi:unnamed protein product, partial [Cyprideis torosa]